MTDYHKEALTALNTLITSGGSSISDDDFSIFEKNPNETEQYNKRLSEIYNAIFRGFFYCAAKGLALVPEKKVTERFGVSIQENYPEANEVYLRFAKTYWTLRVLTYDLMESDIEWIGAHLLGKLEQDIGPVFFPFPGHVKISPSQREKFQRQLIEESKTDIDVEEFIKGNPILLRDRASRRGCLRIFLLFPLLFSTFT